MTGLVRPTLLDLFCCAGGAAMGYHRAGFDIVGVDVERQPNYPFAFHPGDALEVLQDTDFLDQHQVVAVHASPPCQHFTAYRRTGNVRPSPNLIPQTRELLKATDLPFVIENVETAKHELRDPVTICGSMFDPPMEIRRHRLFETNWGLEHPMWPCRHKLQTSKRFPGGRSKEQGGSNRFLARGTIEVGTWDIPLETQQAAMGMDWTTLHELSEAIPPAYTEFIGKQLVTHLVAAVAA